MAESPWTAWGIVVLSPIRCAPCCVRSEVRRDGASIDFHSVYERLIATAIVPRSSNRSGRRGDDRRHRAQTDVRAADPLLVRGGRSHLLQCQRVLRAGSSPRCPALLYSADLVAGTRLPFDVELDRGLPHSLGPAAVGVDVEVPLGSRSHSPRKRERLIGYPHGLRGLVWRPPARHPFGGVKNDADEVLAFFAALIRK